MKILSLFDGMACGMLAMLDAGVKVDSYDAYEIDKYAVKVAQHNFPTIAECGDVFDADFSKYHDIDFLIGGSPCTYWSIAQTKNRETVANGVGWKLFNQYVIALHQVQPKYFIYENNKSMSKEIRASIDKAFGFEAVLINSALVSAQNRERLYWVGKKNNDGSYSKVDISQPKDKGILLKDILDNPFSAEPMMMTESGKSFALTSTYYKLCNSEYDIAHNYERHQRSMVAEPINTIYQVGAMPMPNGELSTSAGFRIYSIDAKGRYLCANGGGAGAKTGLYAIPIDLVPEVAKGKDIIIYRVHDGRIIIKGKEYPIKLQDGYYIIRKLTVNECKKLQTVPEWYDFSCVSKTQAYKMLGNGWTVKVISYLITNCLNS